MDEQLMISSVISSLDPPTIAEGEQYTDVTFPCAVWSSLIALWDTRGTWGAILGIDEDSAGAAIEFISHSVNGNDIDSTARALGTTRRALLTFSMQPSWRAGSNDDALSAAVRYLAGLIGTRSTEDIMHQIAVAEIRYFPERHWVVSGWVRVGGTALERGLRRDALRTYHASLNQSSQSYLALNRRINHH